MVNMLKVSSMLYPSCLISLFLVSLRSCLHGIAATSNEDPRHPLKNCQVYDRREWNENHALNQLIRSISKIIRGTCQLNRTIKRWAWVAISRARSGTTRSTPYYRCPSKRTKSATSVSTRFQVDPKTNRRWGITNFIPETPGNSSERGPDQSSSHS